MLSNISKNKFKLFSTQINHEFTSSLNVKSFDEIKQMVKLFPSRVYYRVNGEYVIKTTPERLYSLLVLLKYHTNFRYSQLRGLTAMDHPTSKLRFEVVYFLLSIQNSRRLSISVSLAEGTSLPSIVSLYSSAGWYERETWDRFGVFFRNHPDFRRRLTDYGFKGHPLRKDFPLTGFVEVCYDDFRKRILYEGVNLPQEFRMFTLENPWKV